MPQSVVTNGISNGVGHNNKKNSSQSMYELEDGSSFLFTSESEPYTASSHILQMAADPEYSRRLRRNSPRQPLGGYNLHYFDKIRKVE